MAPKPASKSLAKATPASTLPRITRPRPVRLSAPVADFAESLPSNAKNIMRSESLLFNGYQFLKVLEKFWLEDQRPLPSAKVLLGMFSKAHPLLLEAHTLREANEIPWQEDHVVTFRRAWQASLLVPTTHRNMQWLSWRPVCHDFEDEFSTVEVTYVSDHPAEDKPVVEKPVAIKIEPQPKGKDKVPALSTSKQVEVSLIKRASRHLASSVVTSELSDNSAVEEEKDELDLETPGQKRKSRGSSDLPKKHVKGSSKSVNHASKGPGVAVGSTSSDSHALLLSGAGKTWFNCTAAQLPVHKCTNCLSLPDKCHFCGWGTPCTECDNRHKSRCTFSSNPQELAAFRELAMNMGRTAPSEVLYLYSELESTSLIARDLLLSVQKVLESHDRLLQQFDSIITKQTDSDPPSMMIGSPFQDEGALSFVQERLDFVAKAGGLPAPWVYTMVGREVPEAVSSDFANHPEDAALGGPLDNIQESDPILPEDLKDEIEEETVLPLVTTLPSDEEGSVAI
ncbi:hypothetical protein BDZ94DRAFT_1315857 [Collybia nuda]|uniref:Uncharacterized protein n=1 Tax=Collybia nuda TaxID=64659 RepID=A0A9P5XRX4_9AGAR|nr:hypothetical protein BDZ94DRAFT_1315857 [Collybia nuda]